MDSICTVRAVVSSCYQNISPHALAEIRTLCEKARAEFSRAEMTVLNAAVEHVLAGSLQVSIFYCSAVYFMVCKSVHFLRNRIIAGVATVELVLFAMMSHAGVVDVQAIGATALAGLGTGNSNNIAGMLALGGIETLIASADNHVSAKNVQENVCAALYSIALYSADGRVALRRSRAADVATRAKVAHNGLMGYADYLLKTLSAV